jgi:hypothetical protein
MTKRVNVDANTTVSLLNTGSSKMSVSTDLFLHMSSALALQMAFQRYNRGFDQAKARALNGRRLPSHGGERLGWIR